VIAKVTERVDEHFADVVGTFAARLKVCASRIASTVRRRGGAALGRAPGAA
jgi:hypothetical protein